MKGYTLQCAWLTSKTSYFIYSWTIWQTFLCDICGFNNFVLQSKLHWWTITLNEYINSWNSFLVENREFIFHGKWERYLSKANSHHSYYKVSFILTSPPVEMLLWCTILTSKGGYQIFSTFSLPIKKPQQPLLCKKLGDITLDHHKSTYFLDHLSSSASTCNL